MENVLAGVSTSRRRARVWTVLGVGLFLFFSGALAHAGQDDAKTAAKAKLAEGARLMDAGDYAQALSDFEDAYKLVPNAKILFDIGLANVGLARYPEAVRAFEQFVAQAKNVPSTVISDAQKQIESLRPKVASVEITASQPGIEIIIDGRSQGKTPLTVQVYVDPGQHRLLAQKDESSPPTVQVFNVAGGEHQILRVVLPAAAIGAMSAGGGTVGSGTGPNLIVTPNQSAEDDKRRRPVYKQTWFWGVVGAGVVAAAVTSFLVFGRSSEYPNASLGSVRAP